MTELFTVDGLIPLAIILGSLIILMWFLISLLMLREFRKFSLSMTEQRNKASNNETLEMCQQSVENALNFTVNHTNTLNELIAIQQALEAQVIKLEAANAAKEPSVEEQTTVKELNHKLERAHGLVKRLKNDLDRSIRGLQLTKQKLSSQTENIDTLRTENIEMQKNLEQLEQEYIRISKSAEAQNLIGTNRSDSELANELSTVKQSLNQAISKLKHMEKEKLFIEKRYIEMVKELEGQSKKNVTPSPE